MLSNGGGTAQTRRPEYEINWPSGISIHTVVTREARSGEQSCPCTGEGERHEIHCKGTERKGCASVEAAGIVHAKNESAEIGLQCLEFLRANDKQLLLESLR